METTLTHHESVGVVLQQTREHYGVTRAQAAERIKIPERYLEMLEDDAYVNLPDDVYAKIFLKTYCKFLGLETEEIVKLYNEQRSIDAALRRENTRRHPLVSVPTAHLIVAPKLIGAFFAVAIFFGILGYIGWGFVKIVTPPKIALRSPADGLVTIDRTIAVEGMTQPEATLRINGTDVAVADDGRFSDVLTLRNGLNTIILTASKKHSKEMTVTRHVIVQTPIPVVRPLE